MRHQSRETAFKIIYQVDMGSVDVETALAHTMEEDGLNQREQAFCRELDVPYHIVKTDIYNIIFNNLLCIMYRSII